MIFYFFATLAALIHVYIFFLESVLWGKPKTNKVFGLNTEQAEQNRLFAFNQGYYNLFLSVAIFGGMALSESAYPQAGIALILYSLVSMLGAALVLYLSQRKLYQAALIQGLPPFLGLCFYIIF